MKNEEGGRSYLWLPSSARVLIAALRVLPGSEHPPIGPRSENYVYFGSEKLGVLRTIVGSRRIPFNHPLRDGFFKDVTCAVKKPHLA